MDSGSDFGRYSIEVGEKTFINRKLFILTALIGVLAALGSAAIYHLLDLTPFLSASLSAFSFFFCCAVTVYLADRFQPRIVKTANRPLVAVILLLGVMLISLLAGIANRPQTKVRTVYEAKDTLVLVDKSASMAGEKDTACMNAVGSFLSRQPKNTKVAAAVFNDDMKYMNGSLTLMENSSDNQKSVMDFLKKTDASGGTELFAALKETAAAMEENGQILMLTDAVWSSGSDNQSDIVNTFNRKGIRFSGVLIRSSGTSPEEGLLNYLQDLATKTGGKFIEVTDLTALDAAIETITEAERGVLFGLTDGFDAMRLIWMILFGLIFGFTLYYAFGAARGMIVQIVLSALAGAAGYLILWKIQPIIQTNYSMFSTAILLYPYSMILNFYDSPIIIRTDYGNILKKDEETKDGGMNYETH